MRQVPKRIAAIFLVTAAWCQPSAAEDYVLIHAGTLLAVPGETPATAQTIVVAGDRIAEIRSGFIAADALSTTDDDSVRTIDLSAHFVLPGLMDAHSHLMWSGRDRPPKKPAELTRQDLTLWALRSARTTLLAGFTTVRDMASDPQVLFAVRDWIDGGKYLGPTILAAGLPVGALGGHGDTTEIGIEPGDVQASGLCDGTESCRRAVRIQHKLGADLIKMMATGGFSDDTGTDQLFFFDEMEATVAAAHQLGLPVATHAYSDRAIADAVRAGVDSVEHGFGASDATLRAMKKKGIYLVPTLSIAVRPGEARELREKHLAFERALEIGTPIAFGTDVGGIPHQFAAREFGYMVKAGMEPADAIRAATVETGRLLRINAGTLEPGRIADIIAVTGNPLDDVSSLEDIDFVMKSGRVARRDGIAADFFLP